VKEVPFFDLGPLVASEADELHACLDEAIRGGYFVGGPLVSQFETEFAAFVGVDFAIGTGNGLDAIRLILEAYEIGEGDEVIVPAFTFYATWLGVTQTGATPVPVDVVARSANIDPIAIESAITPQTKAIVAVHLYGQAAELSAIRSIAEMHGLILVEDAAQSHGALSEVGMAGAVGHAGAFSFYPTKNLGALGDAGAVTTSDAKIADRIRSRRSYGQGSSKYEHVDTGWNSRLDPLQAAFLSLHLRKLEAWTTRRREIADVYLAALADRSFAVVGPVNVHDSVWHHFVIRARDRAQFQSYLSECGVASDAHYPYAVHSLTPMRLLLDTRSQNRAFPVAERLANEVTSLPMGPWMSDEQVEQVAHALRNAPEHMFGKH
jgi:dTDP-3-amino-3,4,6-trideoxy-alpha-D-glucose transaminase